MGTITVVKWGYWLFIFYRIVLPISVQGNGKLLKIIRKKSSPRDSMLFFRRILGDHLTDFCIK